MTPKRTLIASAIMLLTAAFLSYLSHSERVPPSKPFSSFPKQLGDWTGKEERFDQKVYDILGVDDSILCNYQNPEGRQIQLYVGYYQSQKEGDLIHSPKNCMPGGGWHIIHTSLEKLTIPNHKPEEITVIKLIIEKESRREVVFYWFQSCGRFISSEYLQKIYLVIDSITRHRTDGSFIRLIAPVSSSNGSEETTTTDLKDFAKALIPILEEYIPS